MSWEIGSNIEIIELVNYKMSWTLLDQTIINKSINRQNITKSNNNSSKIKSNKKWR